MSETEEMILILTDTDPIGLCDKAHAFQYDFCPFTGNGKKTCREACQLGIPRSEAVERMANVFYDFCEGCKTYEEYERLAEAALDALLQK